MVYLFLVGFLEKNRKLYIAIRKTIIAGWFFIFEFLEIFPRQPAGNVGRSH